MPAHFGRGHFVHKPLPAFVQLYKSGLVAANGKSEAPTAKATSSHSEGLQKASSRAVHTEHQDESDPYTEEGTLGPSHDSEHSHDPKTPVSSSAATTRGSVGTEPLNPLWVSLQYLVCLTCSRFARAFFFLCDVHHACAFMRARSVGMCILCCQSLHSLVPWRVRVVGDWP